MPNPWGHHNCCVFAQLLSFKRPVKSCNMRSTEEKKKKTKRKHSRIKSFFLRFFAKRLRVMNILSFHLEWKKKLFPKIKVGSNDAVCVRKIAITHRNRLKNQLNNAETSKIINPIQEFLAFSSGGLNSARLNTDATVCVQTGVAGSLQAPASCDASRRKDIRRVLELIYRTER